MRWERQEDQPLAEAIASLVEDVRQGRGISISSHIRVDNSLPPQTVKAIYRIVQEALTNICKHAEATEVQIQLNVCSLPKPVDGEVIVAVIVLAARIVMVSKNRLGGNAICSMSTVRTEMRLSSWDVRTYS